LSPYRSSEGNLKKLAKYVTSSQIIEVAAAQEGSFFFVVLN